MCNCSGNTNSLCNKCSSGLLCQCPPDYSILPLPVNCGCCPSGYTWSGPTMNYPNGSCTNSIGNIVPPIPCTNCVKSIDPNCVILPAVPCLGIPNGMTLLNFISSYLCSTAFVSNILTILGSNSGLQQILCQIQANCPPINSTTPIIGPVVPGP